MEEKLKKTIKTSKQGIWIVLILSIVVNGLAIVGAKSILSYIENYWVSIIYMTALIVGLVLYKKEKYYEGAEIVQWAALANIIIQFVQFITYYIITKLLTINVVSFLIGTIIPIVLVVESLKVIRLVETQKRSLQLSIIAIIVIVVICVAQVFGIIYTINKISSTSSSNSNTDNVDNTLDKNVGVTESENDYENKTEQNTRKTTNGEILSYSLGEFSNITWSTTQIKENADLGIKFYIQNSKVYYEYENDKIEITTVKGTPKKVEACIKDGLLDLIVITTDGKVWISDQIEGVETKIDNFKIVETLKEYTIVDMGKISRGEHYQATYYKTSTGKTIDEWGFELDVAKERMFDSYALVLAEIYVGKDRRISYIQGEYEQENLKYISDIKAKKIYFNMDYKESVPCYIVVDENNKVYQIVFEISGRINIGVKSEEVLDGKTVDNISYYYTGEDMDKSYFVEFKMNDGTLVTNQIAEVYYDAEIFNTMELN